MLRNIQSKIYQITTLVVVSLLCVVSAASQSDTAESDAYTHHLDGGKLSIKQPHSSWLVDRDTTTPPVIFAMISPDSAAKTNVQKIDVPGITLKMIKPMILSRLASQVKDFEKISERSFDVEGIDAFEFTCTGIINDITYKNIYMITKPSDLAYVIKCSAPEKLFKSFETDFRRIIGSVRILLKAGK